MSSVLTDTRPALSTESNTPDEAVVAVFKNHTEAEAAVHRLAEGGLPLTQMSIVGRNFETHEEVVGFYRPADAALDGAGQGAWYGGLFGLMLGALGFFVVPVVGAVMVIGPLAGMIAGAIGGAGAGALINGLITAGVPKEQALIYQERLQAGEFMVVVHGSSQITKRSHEILEGTPQTLLRIHSGEAERRMVDSMDGMKM